MSPDLHPLPRRLASGLIGLLAASCILGGDEKQGAPSKNGAIRFGLRLEQNEKALGKSAAADTTFDIDSVLIVLSAEGRPDTTFRLALTGRADLGSIGVATEAFELAALRQWRAKFISIDTGPDSLRRDTVHYDSAFFGVNAAETTFVNKSVSPMYSIVRARFLSAEGDSLPNNILYLRLRVGGVTRDSIVLGGKNAGLKWLQTLPGTVIYAAGDSGRFLRSTNDAQTSDVDSWEERVLTTHPLVGGHFPNAQTGYVFSVTGQTFHTGDSGKSWTTRAPTADSLNAAWFTSTSTGFSVGQRGGIYKTQNDGNSWFTLVSNTPHHLNGVTFPSANVGYVVGENETILKTVNGSAEGGAPPENSGIVWSPVAGGWFTQTSNAANDIRAIHFTSKDSGWAMGAGGYSYITYNGGAVWSARNSIGGLNARAMWMISPTRGFVVGDGGVVRRSLDNEYDWPAQTTNTTQNLYDVRFSGKDTGWAVGAAGTVMRTVNGSAPNWPYSQWAAQSVPGTAGWNVKAAAADALHAVHFADASSGWAVGASGAVRATVDGGESWSAQESGTDSLLRAVHFTGSSSGVAVGDGESITRTTDGGATWTDLSSGWSSRASGTASTLNAVHFADASRGWAVGASGAARTTSDGGETWSPQESEATATLRGVSFSGATAGVAVGDDETVSFTANGGDAWTRLPVGFTTQASFTPQTLNSLHFANMNTGWAVGVAGVVRKTSDAGANWTPQASNVSAALHAVRAQGANDAVAAGDGEIFARTTDGSTWTAIPSGWDTLSGGGSAVLNALHFANRNAGWAVGAGGRILATSDAGANWASQANNLTRPLRGVFALSATTAVAVGDSGVVKRTTDGATWNTVSSGVVTDLRGVYFNGNTGWAVGASGAVRFSSDGGATWGTQTGASGTLNAVFSSGTRVWMVGDGGTIWRRTDLTNGALSSVANGAITAENLHGVYFTSANVGYVVGQGGLIARCNQSANANWTLQTSGTTETLRHVFFKGNGTTDTGYVVGDNGVVLKTVNAGTNWTRLASGTTEHLYALHMTATTVDTVFAAGANGKLLKTVSGGHWSNRGTPQALRGLWFSSAAIGFAVGDSGTLLRTMNGGTNWRPLASGTTRRLNAVSGTGTTRLLAVGDNGVVVRSTNPTTGTPTINLPSQTATTENLNGVALTTTNFAYAVGDNGVIIKTSVSNNTPWVLQTSGTTEHLRHVVFKGNGTADTGYVFGDNGVVLKTVNGGTNWLRLATGTTADLRAGHFGFGPDTVYAAGEAGVLLKTLAGGNWADKASPVTLRAAAFATSTTAFVAGDSGVILRSQNAGASWRPQASGVASRLNGLYTNGSRVWVVGDGGVIRRSINPTSTPTTWSTLRTGSERLNAVWFGTNDDFGYAVGDNGLILRTAVDANNAWSQVGAGVTGENLVAVHGRGGGTNDTVYAVGENGTILKTVNGGTNWTVETPGTSQPLNAVHALTGHRVVVAGGEGTVRKTMAGGTWSGGAAQTLRGVSFHSSTLGFAVGDGGTLLRTTNGGATWSPLTSGVASRLNGVHANGSRVWMVGDGGVIRRSTNPTTVPPTWSSLRTGSERLNAVHFTSNSVGYAVGEGGLILKTTVDANNVWTPVGVGVTNEDLHHVHLWGSGGANDTGYASGANGVLLKTTNSGTNWTLESVGSSALNGVQARAGNFAVIAGADGTLRKLSGPVSSAVFRSVFPVTSTLAYLAGSAGTIAKTVDAGASWNTQSSGTSENLNGIGFWNASRGYAVGNAGTILKTEDGGATWSPRSSGTTNDLLSVQVVSADSAYASGRSGLMLKTGDGGATWYAQETPNANDLNKVYFLNSAVGFAAGNSGTILNAVNQGDNWTGGGIKRSLKAVHFASVDTGWIVGADGVILKTVDGGLHWIEQHRVPGQTLYGVYFINGSTGWASGEDGVVLKTVNGGSTWTPQVSGTSITLRAVNFRDANRGFIIGGTESILETSTGGNPWSGLFVGVPGQREFDKLLTWKYLRANQSQQVIIEAVDRFSLPLRGYQSVIDLLVGEGQDSTIASPMAKCGYGPPTLACAP